MKMNNSADIGDWVTLYSKQENQIEEVCLAEPLSGLAEKCLGCLVNDEIKYGLEEYVVQYIDKKVHLHAKAASRRTASTKEKLETYSAIEKKENQIGENEDKLCPVLHEDYIILEGDKYKLKPGSTIYNLGQQTHICSMNSYLEEVYIWLTDMENQWICEKLYQCKQCGKIYLPMHFLLASKTWVERYIIKDMRAPFLRGEDIRKQYRIAKRKTIDADEYIEEGTKIWYSDNHEGVFHNNRIMMEKHFARLGPYDHPMLKTIFKCPKCNKWIVNREVRGKFSDVIEHYDFVYEDEKAVEKIAKGNFLVRTNVKYCMSKKHRLLDINARVKVMLNNRTTIWMSIPAAFCAICNRYYILEYDYWRIKKIGHPICRIAEQKYDSDGNLMFFDDLMDESFSSWNERGIKIRDIIRKKFK